MTVNARNTLDKICNNEIFNNELYFVGGTALAYCLNYTVYLFTDDLLKQHSNINSI